MPARKLSFDEKKPTRDVLFSLALYEFLDRAQVTTRLYRPSLTKFAAQVLTDLTREQFVEKIRFNDLVADPTAFGFPKGVWRLKEKGRQFVVAHGLDAAIPPPRGPYGPLVIPHALNVASVGIGLELLARRHREALVVHELRTGRYLKHASRPMAVAVHLGKKQPETVTATYTPDLRVLLERAGRWAVLAFEIDRGTEDEEKWRRKIAGFVAWSGDPFRELYGEAALGLAVVAVPGPPGTVSPTRRVETLSSWTLGELRGIGKDEWAGLLRFRAADAAAYTRLEDPLPPEELFCEPCWLFPASGEYAPLIGGVA